MRRTLAAAMLFICVALLLAACGGGGSSSSGSTESAGEPASGGETTAASESSGGSSGVQAAAEEAVAPFLKAPTKIWIEGELEKTPETGKTIDVMDCGAPACTAWAEAAVEGAEALGWSGKKITMGTTPQQITAAWNQVVRDPPDAVVSNGIPRSLFSNQLAELAKQEIPVVNDDVAEESGEGEIVLAEGPGPGQEAGAVWADWVVSQLGEEADVLNVVSPEFPITSSYTEGYEAEIKKLGCTTCKMQEVSVSASEIGSGQNTTAIIGALRSNSGINYIVGVDDLMSGLPSALQTAGLTEQVGIAGKAPGPPQYKYLEEEGPYEATIVFPAYELGWSAMDYLARTFNGESTAPSEANFPSFLMTLETLEKGATSFYPFIPNFEEEFKKLWKVG